MACAIFGDAGWTVTVRAEMSRLRRHLGRVLRHRPYRFHDRVEVAVQRPAHPGDLLPAPPRPLCTAAG
ncbi:hypothetical protein ABZ801_26640 [Actinomadura sp. NPDC047616]|uniref:hypothetical protein n=1 Tax=Actinomadura sp. NPDC047616 TaxID=3155914 RepID=UPI0033EA4B79